MNKLNQGYYKIWKNDFYTIEANIDRSLWEDKYIKSFEKRLNKIILEIFENSKNTLLENNILISILFTGDKKVAELNNYYRKIHKSTNVLSFPSKEINNGNEMFLGDIVFSSQTIIEEAKRDKLIAFTDVNFCTYSKLTLSITSPYLIPSSILRS